MYIYQLLSLKIDKKHTINFISKIKVDELVENIVVRTR